MKTIARNKRAYLDYEVLETFEAGVALKGYEVKSIKKGRINLRGSYVALKGKELYLINTHIPPYQPENTPLDYDPTRSRKLLVHKKEINYLIGKIRQKSLTLIPLKVYTKRGKIKISFGIGKGKRKPDKRELIKKREVKRAIERALKRG